MAAINANPSHLLKVVASSVAIARKAGSVIRGIMKGGDLGIVDKVQFNRFPISRSLCRPKNPRYADLFHFL